jgi:hypothetical protein
VNLDTPGIVSFFLNGKRIAGCISRTSTGTYPNYTATCSWRPTVQGAQRITARLTTSIQGAATPTSSPLSVFVNRRVTTR